MKIYSYDIEMISSYFCIALKKIKLKKKKENENEKQIEEKQQLNIVYVNLIRK